MGGKLSILCFLMQALIVPKVLRWLVMVYIPLSGVFFPRGSYIWLSRTQLFFKV